MYLFNIAAAVTILLGPDISLCKATKSDIAATLYDIEFDLTQRLLSEFNGAANLTFELRKNSLRDVRLNAVNLKVDLNSVRLVDVSNKKPVSRPIFYTR